MAKETTMIKVEVSTRDKAKEKAEKKGMTMMGYIKYLVNKDK